MISSSGDMKVVCDLHEGANNNWNTEYPILDAPPRPVDVVGGDCVEDLGPA
jgi:hypothetical protein